MPNSTLSPPTPSTIRYARRCKRPTTTTTTASTSTLPSSRSRHPSNTTVMNGTPITEVRSALPPASPRRPRVPPSHPPSDLSITGLPSDPPSDLSLSFVTHDAPSLPSSTSSPLPSPPSPCPPIPTSAPVPSNPSNTSSSIVLSSPTSTTTSSPHISDSTSSSSSSPSSNPSARPMSPLNYFVHNGYRYDGDVYTLRPPQERSIASRPERILEHKPAPLPHRQLFNRIYSEGTYNARPSSLRRPVSPSPSSRPSSTTTPLAPINSATATTVTSSEMTRAMTEEGDDDMSANAQILSHLTFQENMLCSLASSTCNPNSSTTYDVMATDMNGHDENDDLPDDALVDLPGVQYTPLPVVRPPSVRPAVQPAGLSEAIAAARQARQAGLASGVAVTRRAGQPRPREDEVMKCGVWKDVDVRSIHDLTSYVDNNEQEEDCNNELLLSHTHTHIPTHQLGHEHYGKNQDEDYGIENQRPKVSRSYSSFAPTSQSQALASRSGRIPNVHRRPSFWRVLSR